ncbi:flavodoxin family protein [Romboutsia ilealis]|uniref:Flavodoxin family protein n=1 Tax=Romboutsia faecis TaxID=2764597 RepID=A0ABR7JPC5_9FIRM|nr:flavodoxin family protein [Romboutsia faecis]MBC5996767.1 flavodoxin family protein [Romboutsia faecis]MRN24294.1 flavodoxin family protein [Romboutsia ilealis]
MKVLLVNGSPDRKGCTFTALEEIAKTLEENGVETEIFQVGNKPIAGCIGCGSCRKTGECFIKDIVNEFVEKAKAADGFIFGSPVHYAAASGAITSFLDRVFYSAGRYMQFKPASVICSARRAGTTATLDQLTKYLTISNMPVVSSQYWNMVHGNSPKEVKQDLEGMQTMRVLGRNMAWLIKCIELGKNNNVNRPELEDREMTNFIN